MHLHRSSHSLTNKEMAGIAGAGLLALGAAAFLARKINPGGGPVGNDNVPEPAKHVDLDRYLGTWYEQYRYEAPFQKDMDAVSADYVLKEDGSIKVVNRGRTADGQMKQSIGKAKVVDTDTNAKLKVSFFGPFYGDYWVLDHCDEYRWSIVGEPSGRFLWVLTRDQNPDPLMLAMLEGKVKAMGYDWDLVRRTEQPRGAPDGK